MAVTSIERVEILPLRVPEDRGSECDGTAELTLLRLTDRDGNIGLGEINGPIGAAQTFIESPSFLIWARGMAETLVGEDPMDRTAIWDRIYDSTIYTARRGIGIAALSGVDIALHDLAARQLDIPVYKLLGGSRQPVARPYGTIFPGMPLGRDIDTLMEEIFVLFDRAKALGFSAVKMEVMFDDLVNDDELAELIREGRRRLGDETELAVDFAYRWRDWRQAARLIEKISDCDILFVEAALAHDDLAGHKMLSERSPFRVCGAELAATRWEILDWIERGRVDVVQPAVTRAGGFTEMLRIANLCELSGIQCIPHGWLGGIGSMCQIHLQLASPAMPYVEYLHPDLFPSAIRGEVTWPQPDLQNGVFSPPEKPGLGIDLCSTALEKYLVDVEGPAV